MPGSIRKREGKRGTSYMARIDLGRRPDGSREVRTRSFRRKSDAEDWLVATADKLRRGEYIEPSQETVDELVHRWLDSRTDLSQRSVCYYEQIYRDYCQPNLGHLPISQVSPREIEAEYNRWRGTTTPAAMHVVLSQAFRVAERQRLINRNPCQAVTVPRYHSSDDEEPVRVWTAEQLHRFLHAVEETEPWYHPILSLMAATGMRPGEALALRWEDVALDRNLIHVNCTVSFGRGGRIIVERPKRAAGRRQVSIDQGTVAVVREHWCAVEHIRALRPAFGYFDGHNLVCPSINGKLMSAQMLNNVVTRVRERLGLPALTPHGLRHTHASLLLAAGRPIHYVQRRLGHSSATTTYTHYAHLVPLTDHQDAETYAALLQAAGEQTVDSERVRELV